MKKKKVKFYDLAGKQIEQKSVPENLLTQPIVRRKGRFFRYDGTVWREIAHEPKVFATFD